MKFLVLAAGGGTRLRPYTETLPKCMVPLHSEPLLSWQLGTARAAGIEDLIVVGGYLHEKLLQGDHSLVLNLDFGTTNMVTSLWRAEEHIKDDIIISYGDIVYEQRVLESLMESDAPISVIVDNDWREYWEKRFDDPLDDAESLKIGDDGNIVELGKPPNSADDIQGQYIGLIRFQGDGIKWVRELYEKELEAFDKGETCLHPERNYEKLYMTDLLQALIDHGHPVKPVFVDGRWLEVDSIKDLTIASQSSEVTGGKLVIRRNFPLRRFEPAPVVWITGVSGTGKTTIARELIHQLENEGHRVMAVDGDAFRRVMGNSSSYDPAGRLENAKRISGVCKWISEQGIIVVCATMSLFHEVQEWNRTHIRKYFEVYVTASDEVLRARDEKGMYSKSSEVVGVDQTFDIPKTPDLEIENSQNSDSVIHLAEKIRSSLSWKL